MEANFINSMKIIIAALEEKGYDPYAQLRGYLEENDEMYITSNKNARTLIMSLDKKDISRYLNRIDKKRNARK